MTIYRNPALVVRLYNNPKYGNRSGPNRHNQLVLNGSVEINKGKVFVDLARTEHMAQSVHTDFPHLHVVLASLETEMQGPSGRDDILVGQLKFVGDGACKLDGGIAANLTSKELIIFLFDEGTLVFKERLGFSRCRTRHVGERIPDYFASSVDLDTVAVSIDPSAKARAASMLASMSQGVRPSNQL